MLGLIWVDFFEEVNKQHINYSYMFISSLLLGCWCSWWTGKLHCDLDLEIPWVRQIHRHYDGKNIWNGNEPFEQKTWFYRSASKKHLKNGKAVVTLVAKEMQSIEGATVVARQQSWRRRKMQFLIWERETRERNGIISLLGENCSNKSPWKALKEQ